MIVIYDRDVKVANVELIDGKIEVEPFVDWIEDFVEELREGKDDAALFASLTKRLRGHLWADVAKQR